MKITAGLLLDLGNSETRAVLISKGITKHMTFDNEFAEIPKDYRFPAAYADEKTTVFLNDGLLYANGKIVSREFTTSTLRPTAYEKKSEQLVTKLTVQRVMIAVLRYLSELNNVPISELEVTFNVKALLPPLEESSNTGKMVELIKSVTKIDCRNPSVFTVNVKYNDIEIFPEGLSAFFGAMFAENNGDCVAVEDNVKFQQGYVLCVDIGAGTTDVCLIRDSELVQNSKETFKLGGNTVKSLTITEIKKKFGFAPNDFGAIISEGILHEGTKINIVDDLLTLAKEAYSTRLMSEIRVYLEGRDIELPLISGLLVVGGGSIPTVRDGVKVSESLADVLIRYISKLAPNINLVETKDKDVRRLNIEGLLLLHNF